MPEVRIENWAILNRDLASLDDAREPKEGFSTHLGAGPLILYGKAWGHRTIDDGHHVATSKIVRVELSKDDYIEDSVVTTESGTKYRLGRINKVFKEWLKNPINHKAT